MRTTRIRFQELKIKGVKRWKDPQTGKPRQQTRVFMQTLNPFNKTADGRVKTSEDIMPELKAERDAWLKQETTKKMSKQTLLEAAQALAKVLPRSGDGLTAYHAREPLLELRQAIADEIAACDRQVEPGKLEVGLTTNEMEVLVNHPEMLTAPGVKGGYIVFSPQQAVDFGTLMIKKAGECKKRKG